MDKGVAFTEINLKRLLRLIIAVCVFSLNISLDWSAFLEQCYWGTSKSYMRKMAMEMGENGAELSIDHHLVSWICNTSHRTDLPGKPTRTIWDAWDALAESFRLIQSKTLP